MGALEIPLAIANLPLIVGVMMFVESIYALH